MDSSPFLVLVDDLRSTDAPYFDVRCIASNKFHEGMSVLLDRDLYIGQSALDTGDPIAIALTIFAEYQHNARGGGLNEEDAMAEFIKVRRELPDRVRTEYINRLHHAGTKNEY